MAIDSFDFAPGDILSGKYEVLESLGSGWEGEVYLISERSTGIKRAAKFFYPKRNPGGKTLKTYARKMHKLRHCEFVTQYYTQESMPFEGGEINYLVSEYVDGVLLSNYLQALPGKRLNPYKALHLLHTLTCGVEAIHKAKEYHGDLHTDNIMIQKVGLDFRLKLIDFYQYPDYPGEQRRFDLVDIIKIFYEVLGGSKTYYRQPHDVKEIVCGLKKTLIEKKFRNVSSLRAYLESAEFSEYVH